MAPSRARSDLGRSAAPVTVTGGRLDVGLGRAVKLDLGEVCAETLASGERHRLLPAFLEFVGEPIEQPATGAALEEDERRRLAPDADATQCEQQLLVGPVEAVVLGAGRTKPENAIALSNDEGHLAVAFGV